MSIALSLQRAQLAHQHQAVALIEFQEAAQTGDWKKAEEAREKVLATMESYLDEMTAAYKAAQRGPNG